MTLYCNSPFSAVIMAGGSGTRFWPRSRRLSPKQTLPFLNGESLLQRTVSRLSRMISPEDFLIVTGEDQLSLLKEQLPQLPESAFIAEPSARNTAPCVGLAAAILKQRAAEKPMLVLAADHYIEKEKEWLDVLLKAARELEKRPSQTIVFGVKAKSPHTGYGYVEFKEGQNEKLYDVEAFYEKPSKDKAIEYLEEGNFYWNSGCFAWMPTTLLDLIEEHMPELGKILSKIFSSPDFESSLKELYPKAPNVSVDYGIMEKCRDIKGLILDVGWSDVGTWPALYELLDKDEDGNGKLDGESLLLDTENSLCWGEDHLIATVGVKDMIVVQSGKVVLVCPRGEGERVKELVENLKKRERKDLL